ncbi:hypothetical protein LAZ67_7000457 [Cordylochernes scorpioides]|uniref:BTB domain-containing protein n=1 Tax=Cordylochernes scorpioides TaxID=51811 RepID=A0ABY6KPG3_9ARAC|nr:hypothetical protein LAZ67_7000457 [Cordylochernes scorpioides]
MKSELLFGKESLLQNCENLTILCEIIKVDKSDTTSGIINNVSEVPDCTWAKDIGSLFETQEFSDVILTTGNKRFAAHKNILSASSSVFAAMFKNKSDLNIVEINDIEAAVFNEILNFIYTEQSPNLDNLAEQLLEAADKYGLENLKVVCEEFLAAHLPVEKAAEIMLLADRCKAFQLMSFIINFIVRLSDKIIEDWLSTFSSYPYIMNEFYKALTHKQIHFNKKSKSFSLDLHTDNNYSMSSHRRSNLSQRSHSSRVQHAYRLRETRAQNIRRLREQAERQATLRSLETPDHTHSRLQAHSERYSSTLGGILEQIIFSEAFSLLWKMQRVVVNADRIPPGQHPRRYNAPTANEVAVVLAGNQFGSRDIVLRQRDNVLKHVSDTHRFYDALQYPLIFWKGQEGYYFHIPQIDSNTRQPLSSKVSSMDFIAILLWFDEIVLMPLFNLASSFINSWSICMLRERDNAIVTSYLDAIRVLCLLRMPQRYTCEYEGIAAEVSVLLYLTYKKEYNSGICLRPPRQKNPWRRGCPLVKRSTPHYTHAAWPTPPSPEPFNFSNPGDWPKWIRRFERFRQASGLINNPENEQVNMLVYCMGDNADDILLSCKIASDQLENYDKVIECFESHFIPRRNIIYERTRFNQRCQQEGEKVNEFITALHSLAEHCNFEMLHDELIRDRIVVGVRDRALSERMQLDTDLTLVKATLMAKQLESVKEQQSSLYQQDSVDQIKKMPNHIKETKRHEPKIRQFKSNQLGGSSHGCTRCGNSNNHDWKNCPAMNSYCNKCMKKGHYAKVCRSEAINEIKSEIAFLGSVEDNSKKWIVSIKVNNRQVNFKIDTGADVNVLPLQYYYQSFQRIKLEKSDKVLQGPNGIPLETVGMIHVNFKIKAST